MSLRFLTPITVSSGSAPFSPLSVPGLKIWLDGNDILNGSNPSTGSKFATWKDKSGNSHDFSQATSANQFTWVTNIVNGKGAVQSNSGGATTWMKDAGAYIGLVSGTASTHWFVIKPTSVANDFIQSVGLLSDTGYVFGNQLLLHSGGITFEQNHGWSAPGFTTSWVANTVYAVQCIYNGGSTSSDSSFSVLINGVALSLNGNHYAGDNGNSPAASMIGDDFGGDPGQTFPGYLCEWLVYNQSVSSPNAASILTYLQNKWGF
jgi:hypothetical protein